MNFPDDILAAAGGKVPATPTANPDEHAPFAGSRDHLAAEFALLDLRIGEEIRRQRKHGFDGAASAFQGLAVSEEEVLHLLQPARRAGRTKPATTSESPAIAQAEAGVAKRREKSLAGGIRLALADLSRRFALDRLHERCLLTALAPEFARRYEKLFGYLHDDLTQRRLSVELAVRLAAPQGPERERLLTEFAGASPLLAEQLISLHETGAESPVPLAAKTLKLEARIVRFLLDDPAGDERLTGLSVHWNEESAGGFREWWPEGLRDWTRLIAEGKTGAGVTCYLHGPPGAGMREAAGWFARELQRPLLVIDVNRARYGSVPWNEILWRMRREATLTDAVVCFEHVDALFGGDEAARHQGRELLLAAATFPTPFLLIGHRAWKPGSEDFPVDAAVWTFLLPSAATRQLLWKTHLNGELSERLSAELPALAATFRVTPGQIRHAAALARQAAHLRAPADPALTFADLTQACYDQTNERLGALARRLETGRTWDDLVLPEHSLAQLRAISAHVKYRELVYGRWGFGSRGSRGCGLNVLFYGGSGTGKTLGAEVLANDLGLALYRIDLSSVVSKYIGETEKNLERIFTEAHAANAILLFDEADALFGKRSEVKDAHDRYANIEIGYLLQRMEDFEGVSILTTNLRNNLDDSFIRRLHFIVEYPFPDEINRLRIWHSHLPAAAPRTPDLDLPFLARQFKLSGGHIRNIAVSAAFNAAASNEPIGMPHFVRGIYREFQKIGRTCPPAEFGPFAALLASPGVTPPVSSRADPIR